MERKIFQDACATFCESEDANGYLFDTINSAAIDLGIGHSKHLSDFQNRTELQFFYATALEGVFKQPHTKRLSYINAIRQDLGLKAVEMPQTRKSSWDRCFLNVIDDTVFEETTAVIPAYLVYTPVIEGDSINIEVINQLPSASNITRGLPKRIKTIKDLHAFNSVTQQTPPSKDVCFRNRQKKWKDEVQLQTSLISFAHKCNEFLERRTSDAIVGRVLGHRPIESTPLTVSAFTLSVLRTYNTGRPPDDLFHSAPSPQLAKFLRAL